MSRRKLSFARIVMFSLAMVGLAERALADLKLFHVDIGNDIAWGSQDGLEWDTAFHFLRDGIDAGAAWLVGHGSDTVEIRVKEGTYNPDQSDNPELIAFCFDPPECEILLDLIAGNKNETFTLYAKIAVRGGYFGEDPGANDRDPANHPSSLSGDLSGNDNTTQFDAGTYTTYSDNSKHVVVADADADNTASLDGFTVTAGFTPTPPPGQDAFGGGVLLGWAIDTAPLVHDCIIDRNYAYSSAGGMFVSRYDLVEVRSNKFVKNRVGSGKGGGLQSDAERIVVVQCDFEGNTADAGGGFYTAALSQLINCTFVTNHATHVSDGHGGGGLFESIPAGGAPTGTELTNCVFRGNTADEDGGGLWIELGSSGTVAVTNCTFSANDAGSEGGGIAANLGSGETLAIRNCIVYGNTAGSGGTFLQQAKKVAGSGTLSMAYSDVEGWCTQNGVSCSSGVDSTSHNKDLNPQFRDTDNMSIAEGSPCIDAGDDSALPDDTADLDGDGDGLDDDEPLPRDITAVTDRIKGSDVDMGAYEFDSMPGGCLPDLNGNCIVNGVDLAIFLAAWTGGAFYSSCPPSYQDADFNQDCKVNGLDLPILLAAWGACPTGSCSSLLGGEEEDGSDFFYWMITGDWAALFEWLASQ